jgi:hypothetical protein
MEERQGIAGDWQGTIGEKKPGAAPFVFKGVGFDSDAFDVVFDFAFVRVPHVVVTCGPACRQGF